MSTKDARCQLNQMGHWQVSHYFDCQPLSICHIHHCFHTQLILHLRWIIILSWILMECRVCIRQQSSTRFNPILISYTWECPITNSTKPWIGLISEQIGIIPCNALISWRGVNLYGIVTETILAPNLDLSSSNSLRGD